MSAFSYVLPLRMRDDAGDGERGDLSAYLRWLAGRCDDVIVVDGSPEAVFARNAQEWSGLVRHVAPDPDHTALMGKVPGVLTGVDLARHERIVLADDDVRYDEATLRRTVALLDNHDLVRPQNVFSSLPWHALWDTARTLLNRAVGADFPGTLAVRRSVLRRTGGYDGDVLFENLELIRTVEAHGGRTVSPVDLYVRRRPPTAAHFWGQRTRQAYDDFAIPVRMATWLSVVPVTALLVWRRRLQTIGLAATAIMLLAERGRRRGGGAAVFPAASALLAPVWIAERGVCAWLAVLQRVRYGGVRYGDSVIRVAAHSRRALRRSAGPGR